MDGDARVFFSYMSNNILMAHEHRISWPLKKCTRYLGGQPLRIRNRCVQNGVLKIALLVPNAMRHMAGGDGLAGGLTLRFVVVEEDIGGKGAEEFGFF